MALALTGAQRALLRGPAIAIRVLVDLYLGSGRYSFWDGAEHMTLSGQMYLAAGAFSSVSSISFGQDLGADGIEIVFDATRLLEGSPEPFDPAALLATIHDETYHQKRVDIRFAFFDPETGEQALTVRRFGGVIDQIEIRDAPPGEDGPGGALMVIRCESIARRYGRREGRTRSHEDQTEIWGADDFFKFTSSTIASERNIVWGRKPAGAGGALGGGGSGLIFTDSLKPNVSIRGRD
ncbi:MAG: hypothetical protein ACRC7C_14390 [Beijerinckiaceae bacterium]